jgi:hypothetical protein
MEWREQGEVLDHGLALVVGDQVDGGWVMEDQLDLGALALLANTALRQHCQAHCMVSMVVHHPMHMHTHTPQ